MVVALSQDSKPKETAEVRKSVESTLKKKEIVLTGNSVGHVGVAPAGAVGKEFHTEAIPTVVLIDTKEVEHFAHFGFNAEIGNTLQKGIDSLLGGKSQGKR